MQLKLLRRYVKATYPRKRIYIHDQNLVIDGDYFRDMYKKSSCPYILGGEYDRYASYLKNVLNEFIESGITCYVVFKGAMDTPLEKRLEIHQNIIDKTDAVYPGREENVYCEPVFFKDVTESVLNELGIKYYVCMNDEKADLFTVANYFQCPILTRSIDYIIFRVTCILPNSISFDKIEKLIACDMYELPMPSFFPRSYGLLAIILSAISNDTSYYQKIPGIIGCQEQRLVKAITSWIRKKEPCYAIGILSAGLNDGEKAEFTKNIKATQKLFYRNPNKLAFQFFTSNTEGCYRETTELVAIGKVPVSYINLKYNHSFTGSWLITDKNTSDAMLPAMDIVFYSYAYLTKTRNILKIQFIGRQNTTSKVWEINKSIKIDYKSRVSFFKLFLSDNLPEFKMATLKDLPEDCWLVLITLMFYNIKNNFAFTSGAYAIILSHVMLSVVTNKIGLIKRANVKLFNAASSLADANGISDADCVLVANNLLSFFYINEKTIKKNFSREILHSMAEFQHCLQHLNYLNGLSNDVRGTSYQNSMNMTFVFNIILCLNGEADPIQFLQKLIGCPSVFTFYKNIVNVFLDYQYKVCK